MDVRLTDFLSCPHCGPAFGLILLADRVEAGRILDGELGCPNCRERYPIRSGFGDLRSPPAGPMPSASVPEPATREEAFRLTALMGVAEGPAYVLLAGGRTRLAPGMADLVEGLEVIALDPALRGWPEAPGVSRMVAGSRLPFRGSLLRAAALTTGTDSSVMPEAARLVARNGRLVAESALPDVGAELESLGFEIIARDADTIVATRH